APLVRAGERASASGLIVVAAAGNYGQKTSGEVGYTGITSPGNAPSAITIGAAVSYNTVPRGDDAIADFSSRGPTWFDGYAKPNVVAPGYNLPADTSLNSYLYKLLPKGRVKAANGTPLLSRIGTSAAAGAFWLTTGVSGSSTIGGQTAAWSQNIIWGDNVLTGDLLYVSNIVWTSNIVWDANIVWDSSLAVVRASNIVWDSDAVWA